MAPKVKKKPLNKTLRRELSITERAIIYGLYEAGLSYAEIARRHNRTPSTIRGIIIRYEKSGTMSSMPRKGRPSELSVQDQRHIMRIVEKHPKWPYTAIKSEAGVNFSRYQFRKLYRASGAGLWLAAKRTLLTPEHAQQRLTFAREMLGKSEDFWRSVIWSDETSIELGRLSRRAHVLRRKGQKYDRNRVQTERKGKGLSVMFWGCFANTQKGSLIALERDFAAKKLGYTADSYIRVLREGLLTFYSPGMHFMHDNAPIHTAKAVNEWFDEYGVRFAGKWPPYSPDLNLIENGWSQLKLTIDKTAAHFSLVNSKGDEARTALIRAAEKAWEEISEDYFEALVSSMPRRLAAVIAARGWYTRY